MSMSGRCVCGAVRYRVSAEPLRVSYCHCETCRRFTGAPVFAAAKVAREAFEVRGATVKYQSSEHGVRHFCGVCGSSLFFEFDHHPGYIEVLIGTLDDCAAVIPTFHGFYAERIGWFDTADELPRHSKMP